MEEIIVEKGKNGIFVCVLEKGEIVEKYHFLTGEIATIGNIYMGTVEEILDGMQACFVEIGLPKKAFLSLKDAMPKVDLVKEFKEGISRKNLDSSSLDRGASLENRDLKISQVLKKGQKILVQIRKEAFEDKGARVSSHVTLAGDYLVLMPETEIITISQKIEDMAERERLLQLVKAEMPSHFGCIIRTEAVGASKEEILFDYQKLWKRWQIIQKQFEILQEKEGRLEEKERLLYQDNLLATKIARDMVKKATKKVYVNDKEIYEQLKERLTEDLLEFQEAKNFIADFGLQTEFEKVENRKIWLKSGAQIVIDKTEALTAIDVNSSHCVGKENLEETIFKINREAATEIMKQIRLKDIGGIIIIDFIDMKKQEHKDEILQFMREEAKKDRSKIEVKDFTQLNLVEMTRKKMYVENK